MSKKQDNSPTFFSARRPNSTVFDMQSQCGPSAFPKVLSHDWRYFVAGGESLDKIKQFIAESSGVDNALKALAQEVGAVEAQDSYFIFENAEVDAIGRQNRLMFIPNEAFICDADNSGNFFANVQNLDGIALKREIIAIQSLPEAEVEAARLALALKYKAESFDGKFFRFHDWQDLVDYATTRQRKKFRLKSNPAFVRDATDGDYFSLDWETDEGFLLADRVKEITARRYPAQRFGQWLASFELDLSLSGQSENRNRPQAEAEKLGEEWIIKVPVIVEGIFGADGEGGMRTGEKEGWVLPPGAKAIAVSQYFSMLEDSGSLRALPQSASAAKASQA